MHVILFLWLWGSAWRPFGPPELRYNIHPTGQKVENYQYTITNTVQAPEFEEVKLTWVGITVTHELWIAELSH